MRPVSDRTLNIFTWVLIGLIVLAGLALTVYMITGVHAVRVTPIVV